MGEKMKRTGKRGCEGTPFDDCDEDNPDLREFRRHAKAEREFLESLLPKEEER